ncbi:S-adenosyl-L-methionine-dependent methyltransferase [Xylariaceae sp. FL0016]|nr:S-adenosyl-L-methionine-dependent methyltransferase [Xylariaceae sp. FL0016]
MHTITEKDLTVSPMRTNGHSKLDEPKTTVTLTGTPETTLVPLIAKALDAQHPDPLLRDLWAKSVIEKLDHDLSKCTSPSSHIPPRTQPASSKGQKRKRSTTVHESISIPRKREERESPLLLTPPATDQIGNTERVTYAQRARYLDDWTSAFLSAHAHEAVTVLHLACGLDSRCLRLQSQWATSASSSSSPPPSPPREGGDVRWIDVDLPDVVALRRRLLPNPKGDYRLVAADVTDEKWLSEVPADRPTVVIFEGLSMYLSEEVGKDLIRRIVEYFPTGELLFDTIGSVVVYLQKFESPIMATGATFIWGVDNPKDLEALAPQLRLCDCLRPTERMGFDMYPSGFRTLLIIYSWLWWFRDASYFVRCKF